MKIKEFMEIIEYILMGILVLYDYEAVVMKRI